LDLEPATAAGLPGWLYDDWKTRFGAARAREIAAGMNESDPLWLLSYHPQATHALLADGCKVRFGPLEGTLEVQLGRPLAELQAYQSGWVQPQNPASTLPVRLLEPEPGEQVYDLASGNGVKAAQLAAAGAAVTSVELYADKLQRAERNLQRLGLRARSVVHDLRTLPDLPPAPRFCSTRRAAAPAPCAATPSCAGASPRRAPPRSRRYSANCSPPPLR
jgi:16S rRNA (cytosine967-C5)-methyltransferase